MDVSTPCTEAHWSEHALSSKTLTKVGLDMDTDLVGKF